MRLVTPTSIAFMTLLARPAVALAQERPPEPAPPDAPTEVAPAGCGLGAEYEPHCASLQRLATAITVSAQRDASAAMTARYCRDFEVRLADLEQHVTGMSFTSAPAGGPEAAGRAASFGGSVPSDLVATRALCAALAHPRCDDGATDADASVLPSPLGPVSVGALHARQRGADPRCQPPAPVFDHGFAVNVGASVPLTEDYRARVAGPLATLTLGYAIGRGRLQVVPNVTVGFAPSSADLQGQRFDATVLAARLGVDVLARVLDGASLRLGLGGTLDAGLLNRFVDTRAATWATPDTQRALDLGLGAVARLRLRLDQRGSLWVDLGARLGLRAATPVDGSFLLTPEAGLHVGLLIH
jgi:hypothetical protein